ncbi:MAG TPA: hypothetical protein VMG41_07335 [Gemmatimonadales bacterium]|nr:hypothetical protein [Gemmatimonadales bacterium]
MTHPLVPERRLEYAASRAIESFFINAGYDCVSSPLAQFFEQFVPADFLFQPGGLVKLFGIQYKVLYNGSPEHWRLAQPQRTALQRFRWIYYGLSDCRDARDLRNSLHALRLKESAFPYAPIMHQSAAHPYRRWWSFYADLEACSTGVKLDGPQTLRDILGPLPDRRWIAREVTDLIDIFVINQSQRLFSHAMFPPAQYL